MNILLTEAEFTNLRQRALSYKNPTPELLQAFCTIVANEMPITKPDRDTKSPWGCILSGRSTLCDGCPAKAVCPHPDKRWGRNNATDWRALSATEVCAGNPAIAEYVMSLESRLALTKEI